MAEQMSLNLKPARQAGDVLRFDAVLPVNSRAIDHRARGVLEQLVKSGTPDVLRDGFAVRRYAENAALVEALRSQLAGKRLKQAARKTGKRLPVKAAVLFAITPEGRRLHALVDQVEERLLAQEAVTLCG